VDGKALPGSHFYHNDLTTTQGVISNDTTPVCQPMVSRLLQWMATTMMVRSIEALPTSLCLTGNVFIEWAMDSPDPAATGRIATRCLMVLNMTIGPVAGASNPVCSVQCEPNGNSVCIKGVCWRVLCNYPEYL
jgi:hypothetical protein